jgi:hypothetical protein
LLTQQFSPSPPPGNNRGVVVDADSLASLPAALMLAILADTGWWCAWCVVSILLQDCTFRKYTSYKHLRRTYTRAQQEPRKTMVPARRSTKEQQFLIVACVCKILLNRWSKLKRRNRL